MSLTVGRILNETTQYKLKLLAGKEGLGHLVQWVHMIETRESARFLHGQELIITEGIAGYDEDGLIAFVQTIMDRNAAGLIVNVGMYMKDIPQPLIAFCEGNRFPLMTMPWEVPLVDVTREICQLIINNASREDSIASIIKNLIFHIGNSGTQLRQLERFGYHAQSSCTVLSFLIDEKAETAEYVRVNSQLRLLCELCAKEVGDQYIDFTYQEKQVILLLNYTEDQVRSYINTVQDRLEAHHIAAKVYIGIEDEGAPLTGVDRLFHAADATSEIAFRKREHVLYYRELGMYQLFLNVNSTDVLRTFYDGLLGRLEQYDRENHTDYRRFLTTYIECGGKQNEVSRKMYIHRNTVTNYLHKIEEIINVDLSSWEGRSMVYAAYCIGQIL